MLNIVIKILFTLYCLQAYESMASVHKQRAFYYYQKSMFAKARSALIKHLRSHPKDPQARNMLGASYYHLGKFGSCIKTLRKSLTMTQAKTFNLYYQGLCYEAQNRRKLARRRYQRALRGRDEFAQRAMIQIALLEYHGFKKKYATYWARLYLNRFYYGRFRQLALKILRSIDSDVYIEDLHLAQNPDMDAALFENHKLSLFKSPHFWIFGSGVHYKLLGEKSPNQAQSLEKSDIEEFNLDLDAVIGFGPYEQRSSEVILGYGYKQEWVATQQRWLTWLEDWTDMTFFPLRADQLLRKHNLFAHFRREMQNAELGLYFNYAFASVGSKLIPPATDYEISQTLPEYKHYKIVPWMRFSLSLNTETYGYLLFEKMINEADEDFSWQSYDLSVDKQLFSFGLRHTWFITKLNMELDLLFGRHDLIYNDPWQDHVRTYYGFHASHYISKSLKVGLGSVIGHDDFDLEVIRTSNCDGSDGGNAGGGESDQVINLCQRLDKISLYQFKLDWYLTRFEKLWLSVDQETRRNSKMVVFDRDELSFLFGYTISFPDIKRIEQDYFLNHPHMPL